jgi:hypothetical protein
MFAVESWRCSVSRPCVCETIQINNFGTGKENNFGFWVHFAIGNVTQIKENEKKKKIKIGADV